MQIEFTAEGGECKFSQEEEQEVEQEEQVDTFEYSLLVKMNLLVGVNELIQLHCKVLLVSTG